MSTDKNRILKYEGQARESQATAVEPDTTARVGDNRSLQAGLIQWLGRR